MPQRFPGFSCNSNGCRRDISVENGSTCDELGPPPAIATCIAGAARTFGTPVVQSHLRRNLVEALGGSAGSRLFLLLKTLDSNKFVKRSEPGAVVFKQHLGEASVGGLLATYATQTSIRRLADPRQLCYSHVLSRALDRLRLPWLAHRVGEAVVLNGSGSYSAGDPAAGDCAAPPYCVAQANPDAWRAFRMAACVCHTGLELRTSKPHTQSATHTRVRLALDRTRRTSRRRQVTKEVVAVAVAPPMRSGYYCRHSVCGGALGPSRGTRRGRRRASRWWSSRGRT